MPQTKRKNQAKPKSSDYNGWRVLYLFIEGVLNLINNNKIYPVFGLLFLSLLGLIVWRLPETELADVIKILINEFVVDKGGLIAIIVITNLGWAYLLRRMTGVYQREIDRLAKIRSELIHNNDRKSIKAHRSTNGEIQESYIVPDVDTTESPQPERSAN